MRQELIEYETWKENSRTASLFDIVSVSLVRKIFYIEDGRNAWHSTWITRYYPDRCATTLDGAKNAVEGMRVSGSTWSIIEMPVLVFHGTHVSLLIGDIQEPTLLPAGYTKNCKPFVASIAESFPPTRTNLRLIAANACELNGPGMFHVYRSRPVGGGYLLNWNERRERIQDLSPFARIQAEHRKSLSENAYLGIVYRQRKSGFALVDYVFGSSPLSESVKVGDVINAIMHQGREVDPTSTAYDLLGQLRPGMSVVLKIDRQGHGFSVEHQVRSFADALQAASADRIEKPH